MRINNFIGALSLAVLVPGIASAELTSLNDSALAETTGQAGLTVDVDMLMTIKEIEYVDGGSVLFRDLSIGGIAGGRLDNIRMTMDIASGGEVIPVGFSKAALLASSGYLDSADTDVAAAIAAYTVAPGSFGQSFNDGDLVIHIDAINDGLDLSSPGNATIQANNKTAMNDAIDFNVSMSEVAIRDSAKTTETTRFSNISMDGHVGYIDFVVHNNGNGVTTGVGPGGIDLADSYIDFDAHFRVDDLDFDWDVSNQPVLLNFVSAAGLAIRNMRIHNERGGDTAGHFGFASASGKIAAAQGIVGDFVAGTTVDGLAIYNVKVNWDWDLPHISFGDTGQSIGEVYLTDFIVNDLSLVVSAH